MRFRIGIFIEANGKYQSAGKGEMFADALVKKTIQH